MKKIIAILSGDGIGPEIMNEAAKVLKKIEEKFGHTFILKEALVGGAAYDTFKTHLPASTLKICASADAILFASVGGPITEQLSPKWKNCETNSILALRKHFKFTTNLRPAKTYPQLQNLSPLKSKIIQNGIDILCIRELSGDVYFGKHKTTTKNGITVAEDQMIYDEKTIAHIAETAFKFARTRRKHLTSVDKANVLDTGKLWRKTVEKIHKKYSDVALTHILVDNCAMQLIKNPSQFDVLLMPNMFGDILSDEASVFSGSLGMLPSASLNQKGFGLYEPSAGSAPDIAGKNLANPIGQILSAAMMLKFSFNLTREHDAIEKAIESVIKKGYRTSDIYDKQNKKDKLVSTSQIGNLIAQNIQNRPNT